MSHDWKFEIFQLELDDITNQQHQFQNTSKPIWLNQVLVPWLDRF